MATEQPHGGRQQTNNHWMQNELNADIVCLVRLSYYFDIFPSTETNNQPYNLSSIYKGITPPMNKVSHLISWKLYLLGVTNALPWVVGFTLEPDFHPMLHCGTALNLGMIKC